MIDAHDKYRKELGEVTVKANLILRKFTKLLSRNLTSLPHSHWPLSLSMHTFTLNDLPYSQCTPSLSVLPHSQCTTSFLTHFLALNTLCQSQCTSSISINSVTLNVILHSHCPDSLSMWNPFWNDTGSVTRNHGGLGSTQTLENTLPHSHCPLALLPPSLTLTALSHSHVPPKISFWNQIWNGTTVTQNRGALRSPQTTVLPSHCPLASSLPSFTLTELPHSDSSLGYRLPYAQLSHKNCNRTHQTTQWAVAWQCSRKR